MSSPPCRDASRGRGRYNGSDPPPGTWLNKDQYPEPAECRDAQDFPPTCIPDLQTKARFGSRFARRSPVLCKVRWHAVAVRCVQLWEVQCSAVQRMPGWLVPFVLMRGAQPCVQSSPHGARHPFTASLPSSCCLPTLADSSIIRLRGGNTAIVSVDSLYMLPL